MLFTGSLLSLKMLRLFSVVFLSLSDVQIVSSCEAGALRQGPKKECRDSMIHKTE